jgi:ABC-type multidrug transport system ATPase subunit
MGIAMRNVSSAYESKKPRLEGVDIDPMAKKLVDKNWEVSLLRSQLADAQMKIKELTVTDKEREEMKDTPSDEIAYLSGNLLCLKRISFECKPGELIAVVGGVGCGKYVELFLTASLFVKTDLAYSFLFAIPDHLSSIPFSERSEIFPELLKSVEDSPSSLRLRLS